MFRLRSSNPTNNKIFLQREWLSLVIVFALVVAGNTLSSSAILLAAAAFVAFCIVRSDIPNAFYWALFLIPNIRMLDGIGITFIANALMALPLIVYFIRTGATKIYEVALIGGVSLCIMELIHDMVLCNLSNLISILAWTINVVLCILVTVDSSVKISKDDVFSALSTGIIMSSAMYLASGLTTLSQIITYLDYGERFTAFADDPNYFSLYICLTIACILSVNGRSLYKFGVLLLLVAIGFLTASKMCIILMVIEFILIFIQVFNNSIASRKNRRFILFASIGLIITLFIFRDYVEIFMQNFLRRLGQENGQKINFEIMTTGRTEIFKDYLKILFNNPVCLLLGYGFNYHLFLGQAEGKGAHNTYLDLPLSWGILGTALFILITYYWVKTYKKTRKIKKSAFINRIPLIILLLNFFDLSCLSASMFPFVISIAIIQLLPNSRTKR